MSWLVHESNLDGKIEQNYKGKGIEFERFKESKYVPYKKAQMGIIQISEEAIANKSKLYDEYSKAVDKFNKGNWITAQSKFRPTVLEEFCGFLFKDLVAIASLGLDFFKKDIYAGLRIDNKGNVEIETRDIDFCIGKEVTTTFASKNYTIRIPLIAIECKTYLDKTMLSGAQFTAQKIKGGTPRVKVTILTETNQVDLREIPTESPVDQIYVLRDRADNPIATDVVWDFFNEIRAFLDRATNEQIIKLPGKLLVR